MCQAGAASLSEARGICSASKHNGGDAQDDADENLILRSGSLLLLGSFGSGG